MCLYIVDLIVIREFMFMITHMIHISVTVDVKSLWEKWYLIFLWSMNYEIHIIQHNCEHLGKIHPIIFNNITASE